MDEVLGWCEIFGIVLICLNSIMGKKLLYKYMELKYST